MTFPQVCSLDTCSRRLRQAYPYKSLLDNFLAATTSAAILVVFLCAIIYKYIALTSEPELQVSSPEQMTTP